MFVEKTPEGKALQRALLQYYEPRNARKVAEALRKVHREDLIPLLAPTAPRERRPVQPVRPARQAKAQARPARHGGRPGQAYQNPVAVPYAKQKKQGADTWQNENGEPAAKRPRRKR